jgi:hypothetical protein
VPTRAPCQITWRKQSERSVSVRQNSMLNIPPALVTSRELTWREDSVSPALQAQVFVHFLKESIQFCKIYVSADAILIQSMYEDPRLSYST